MVVIHPLRTPNRSWMTLASGARQFVVHDALEMMWCVEGSYLSSLTPRTTVISGPLAGAVMITFFAPAVRCFVAPSRLVKIPVDSKTTSTPRSFHGSCAGSLTDRTLKLSPPTVIPSPLALTSVSRLPSTESYFRRCASVAAFVRSLTATKSISLFPIAARMMLRPMRPNPLIPTFTAIATLIALVALSPFFLYQAIRHKKYVGSFGQRFGYLPVSFNLDAEASIWVHAVSVGEVLSARPVVAELRKRYPALRVFLSTTTLSGQQLARRSVADVDGVFYFPFDWTLTCRRTLDAVKPRLLVMVE